MNDVLLPLFGKLEVLFALLVPPERKGLEVLELVGFAIAPKKGLD